MRIHHHQYDKTQTKTQSETRSDGLQTKGGSVPWKCMATNDNSSIMQTGKQLSGKQTIAKPACLHSKSSLHNFPIHNTLCEFLYVFVCVYKWGVCCHSTQEIHFSLLTYNLYVVHAYGSRICIKSNEKPRCHWNILMWFPVRAICCLLISISSLSQV